MIQRAIGEGIQFCEADFDLVRHQRQRTRRLQSGDETRPKVAHAKETHLAGIEQLNERASNFMWVGQEIRAMQQVEINHLDAQPLQRLLAGIHDMLRREVVSSRRIGIRRTSGAHAALAGDEQTLAHPGRLAQHAAKRFLRLPSTVNVRAIEERVAGLVCRQYRGASVSAGIGNPPASVGEPGGVQ